MGNLGQGFSVNLEDGHAHYMGDGCWVLERHEATERGHRRHTFGLTEEDRQALFASEGTLTVPLEDGEAHFMGDGCWVLVRRETLRRRVVRHCIGLTVGDLERLGDATGHHLGMLLAA